MTRTVPPAKPYFSEDDIGQIGSFTEEIVRSGMLTSHEFVRRFEEEFARLSDTKYGIALSSGTAALEAVVCSLGLGQGDEVIVPTNTFTATACAVLSVGARPVMCDIDATTLCADPQDIMSRISPRTRAVILVHIGGLISPQINEIKGICDDHGISLVEDAAHAAGSRLGQIPAGSTGIAGCFSFYPTKVITTGEGGMIATNDRDIHEKALILRDDGKQRVDGNSIVELGYNWRMQEISAAIGLVQLKRLDEILDKRNRIARFYDEKLAALDGLRPVHVPSNVSTNRYKYVVILDEDVDRDLMKERLKQAGVICGGEVYWPPLHLQPAYQKELGTRKGDFPVAEQICRRMMCLPLYTGMSMGEAEYVIEKVEELFSAV
jgi:dTDP-4-amino-4,6-dideoxygalactose transaminase